MHLRQHPWHRGPIHNRAMSARQWIISMTSELRRRPKGMQRWHMGRPIKFCVLLLLCTLLAGVRVKATEDAWTVVTVARGGVWGASTRPSVAEAIAGAVRACKSISTGVNDCGAEFRAIRRGWTLAFLCGDHRILATGNSLQEAEASIQFRTELKRAYVHDMPLCKQVLAVDPDGVIVDSIAELSGTTE